MQRFHVQVRSTANAATVYALLLDGPSWPHWMAVDTVEVESEVKRQVGEVRRFTTGRYVSVETIVRLDRDRRFAYIVESDLFREYHGKVELKPTADGETLIEWSATFSMHRALIAWPMKLFLARFMRRSATSLARFAEASMATSDAGAVLDVAPYRFGRRGGGMMPGGTAPTHAAELVERDAWLDLFAAAPPAAAKSLGLRWANVSGIGLLASTEITIAEMNRAMIVGQAGLLTEKVLDEALNWLVEHAASGWRIQVPPDALTGTLRENLQGRGLTAQGAGWAKFVRSENAIADDERSNATATAGGTVEVRTATSSEAYTFGRLVQSGFGLPMPSADWFAALVGRSGWRCYVASLDGGPVGSGAIFQNGAAAWIGMDTTASAARRNGVQAKLIDRRVADAHSRGVRIVTAETAYPANGEEAGYSSYRNYRRSGFELAYARPNYAPERRA